MIRLLLALVVLGAGIYLILFRTTEPAQQPQVIYQDATDKARGVEEQLQDAAQRQQQLIDEQLRSGQTAVD